MKKVIDGLSGGLEAIADAIVGDVPHSAKVPIPTNSDRGKILAVNSSNNNIGWKNIHSLVDAVPICDSTDVGKVLRVLDVDDNVIYDWDAIIELPTYDPVEDVGKVLAVTADGLAWISLT